MKSQIIFAVLWLICGLAPLARAGEGTVLFFTNPGGAKIYIGGKLMGTSPPEPGKHLAVKLNEGSYAVKAVAERGGVQFIRERNIFVGAGRTKPVNLKLSPQAKPAHGALQDLSALEKTPPRPESKKTADQGILSGYETNFPTANHQPKKNADLTAGQDRFITNSLGMKFVKVAGGCFQMGDVLHEGGKNEGPVHKVCLDDFYMGVHEVTQGEYKSVMGFNPSRIQGRDDYPVETVRWRDAMDFIRKLSEMDGRTYFLPTEAQWEYAAREGGRKVRFGNGKNIADPADMNFNSSPEHKKSYSRTGSYRKKTMPVGSFQPNSLGLYDMSGNVWEWCRDWYGENYYQMSRQDNPQGPPSGSQHVVRGGCWGNGADWLRSSFRLREWPDYRHYYLGFRLVLTERP
ncbi:MAG: hypothetical protein CSB24_02520 [Deltaproteobacteria bacterium]|nr:MAG: hypothetical protein CSB24_02520 [Deltaproteobacteria bacterium]